MMKIQPIIILIGVCFFLLECADSLKADLPQKDAVHFTFQDNAIARGDTTQQKMALVFTGHEFADGGGHILRVLNQHTIKASFFFTGDFYRNKLFKKLITELKNDGHYLGAHSDKHLLYCSWEKRDSLLVSRDSFLIDLENNYAEMQRFGIGKKDAPNCLPPFEWYNDSISIWTNNAGLQLINFTSGTRSNADYTTPDMPNYVDSETIFQSILNYEKKDPNGLNGFMLLIHIGTAPGRTDKFYFKLEELVLFLKNKGYELVRVDELLKE